MENQSKNRGKVDRGAGVLDGFSPVSSTRIDWKSRKRSGSTISFLLNLKILNLGFDFFYFLFLLEIGFWVLHVSGHTHKLLSEKILWNLRIWSVNMLHHDFESFYLCYHNMRYFKLWCYYHFRGKKERNFSFAWLICNLRMVPLEEKLYCWEIYVNFRF